MTRRYSTPVAFKEALEHRLRAASADGEALARRRQRVVFDRFLARVDRVLGDSATLKGGLVLELRLARARATKDVDLRLTGSPDAVLDRLQEAGRLDLGDFMTFEVRPDAEHPEIVNDGAQYDGWRFRAECRLAGKVYGRPFGVDVAFADPLVRDPDVVVAEDVLGFAGIEPPTLRLYPVETHLAEKLHAYPLPRSRPNTRVKDLPDFALLASTRPIEVERLREALRLTFSFRNTHELPATFPDPPPEWSDPYARMALTDELPWQTLPDLVSAVRAFLEPVLDGTASGVWNPEIWAWGVYPDRAVEILKRLVDAQLERADAKAYYTAAESLRMVRDTLVENGRDAEWQTYLARVRDENRRRPRCIEVLRGLDRTPIIDLL